MRSVLNHFRFTNRLLPSACVLAHAHSDEDQLLDAAAASDHFLPHQRHSTFSHLSNFSNEHSLAPKPNPNPNPISYFHHQLLKAADLHSKSHSYDAQDQATSFAPDFSSQPSPTSPIGDGLLRLTQQIDLMENQLQLAEAECQLLYLQITDSQTALRRLHSRLKAKEEIHVHLLRSHRDNDIIRLRFLMRTLDEINALMDSLDRAAEEGERSGKVEELCGSVKKTIDNFLVG